MSDPHLQKYKDIENLKNDTNGRITFDYETQTFKPYQTQSDMAWKRIKKEHGWDKIEDIFLFMLNKLFLQPVFNNNTIKLDERKIEMAKDHLDKSDELQKQYASLQRDLKRHEFSWIHIIFLWFSIPITILATVGLVNIFKYLNMKINSLKLRFMEERFQAINEFWTNVHHDETSLNNMYTSLRPPEIHEDSDCPICSEPIRNEGSNIYHCNPDILMHADCVKKNQETQFQRIGELANQNPERYRNELEKYRFLFTSPCPLCRQPLLSEQLADDLVHPEYVQRRNETLQKEFYEYVMEKMLPRPISKCTKAITRKCRNLMYRRQTGYRPIPQAEEGIEMNELRA